MSDLKDFISYGSSFEPVEVSNAYTAKVNDLIIADTSSGFFSITLPDSGIEIGDKIKIVDKNNTWEDNNLTLSCNSAILEGSTSYTCSGNANEIELTYTGEWVVGITEDRVVKTVFSTSDPTDGRNGTLWIKY